MALLKCHFIAESLGLSTSMTVLLPQPSRANGMNPESRKYKTLYLLHGFSDDDTIWTRRTSVERYADEHGIAVVMPNVHRSYYANMVHGGDYWTFLTEELPFLARSMFPLSDKPEDNFVAGLSMGGYGAFKWALSHPERFAAAGSFSGAVDLAAFIRKSKDDENRRRSFGLIFGDDPVEGTDNDLLELLKRGAKADAALPPLYQWCGTEDFLYEENLSFREACRESAYELDYSEGPGDHSWGHWDSQIKHYLSWLSKKGLLK
ncbi:alpha/beta hydrolase family protein [Paenibacillus sp. PAMC21692]|uniref:alpha/beta hydrolase n=1 Tax=Paenibacillus sp. PAMC21692 TaxID=2762320 RepID=UPI00164D86C9|nr:alpha/beta hydrolase family protein [Paenibacillus sp. PAMC21692]QNK55651.1 esterase family protein [Paenibacillus sp. PAMC21692]